VIDISAAFRASSFTAAVGYQAPEVLDRNVTVLMSGRMGIAHDGPGTNTRRTRVARIIGNGREVRARRKTPASFRHSCWSARSRTASRRASSVRPRHDAKTGCEDTRVVAGAFGARVSACHRGEMAPASAHDSTSRCGDCETMLMPATGCWADRMRISQRYRAP